MELINKKHGKISEKTRLRLEAFFKIQDDKTVLFSAGAVINFGLNQGMFIHFQNDESRWYFYCNDDPDGFKLILSSGGSYHRKAVVIRNKSLVNLIKKRAMIVRGQKFPVKLTTAKFEDNHLIEIDFSKPFRISTVAIMQPKQLKENPVI